jgi:hypothetical protein
VYFLLQQQNSFFQDPNIAADRNSFYKDAGKIRFKTCSSSDFVILLLCVSVIGAAMEANRQSVIGGADLPTYLFVFFRQHSGIYSLLSLGGLVCILVAVILRTVKNKR